MDCRTVHDHLSTYLDHDVPLHMRLALDQHFRSCPQCCQELTRLHTVTMWVQDFPRMEPSPMLLQHIRDQVERLPRRPTLPLIRRLAGALPLQVAAALVVLVSAALVWQTTPHVQPRQMLPADPPAQNEPWLSRERRVPPLSDIPPFDPAFDESVPTPVPLVQAPTRWPGFRAREEFVRLGRDVSAMPLLAGMPVEGWGGEVRFFPSLMLRAADPVQAAQHIWELVPRIGGELLQSQGMMTPAERGSQGSVMLTLSITADHYQTLLEAIRRLPGLTVTEERMAVVGRELPLPRSGSLWRVEHSPVANTPRMTLVITIHRH